MTRNLLLYATRVYSLLIFRRSHGQRQGHPVGQKKGVLMMIMIAVCDDIASFVDDVEKMIKNVGKNLNQDFYVAKYYSGSRLAEDIGNGKFYDMYFLDIKLEGINGIEISRMIREKYRNLDYLIYFISSYPGQYCEEIVGPHTFAFINKPIVPETFERKFLEGIEKLKGDRTKFSFTKNRMIKIIDRGDIVYIESDGHKNTIHYFKNGALTAEVYRGKLAEDMKQLESENFMSPSQSYIVNLDHVTSFQSAFLVLLDDPDSHSIKISRNKSDEVKAAVARYLRKRGR